MTKQEAIDVILNDKKELGFGRIVYPKSLNWAVNYCRAAKRMTGHEFEMQIPYILHNITNWRHPLAKEVRETLRRKEK